MLEVFGAHAAAAGIAVTPATAMRSTPVRCAVQTIAEAIGQLPIHVFEKSRDGSRERATDHPAYALVHDEANDWTSSSDFFEQVTRDALLHGDGFAFINRTNGALREFVRLDPVSMAVERDRNTGEPLYKITEAGRQRYIDRRDILHIKAPSLDGMSGESPVTLGREAISLALVMEQHAAKLFANGARPSGILTFPNKLGAETAPRIKASWNASHAGGNNAGGTAVLEEGGSFTALTFSSVDAQFLELWQHVITEIARIFRVPPHMLFELGRATWGNTEEMGASFVQFGLMRWVKAWQGELRLKLFDAEERKRFSVEFLLDDLVRADIAKRFEAYSKAIASRVLNPNEVRAMENRPPYDGGDVFANPNTSSGEPVANPSDEGKGAAS
ncbi:phage portal protein [Aureimonas sp. ME7]|uniref:phage portal protein n=1 Tax=Aureimonas sp. ME7 TaxID=2744252 RepID=UPI0015FB54E4|nr:phage portal protein [Aureimonas sp. ME7]